MSDVDPRRAPFLKFYDSLADRLLRAGASGTMWAVVFAVGKACNGISRKKLIEVLQVSETAVDDARRRLRGMGLIVEESTQAGVIIRAAFPDALPQFYFLRRHRNGASTAPKNEPGKTVTAESGDRATPPPRFPARTAGPTNSPKREHYKKIPPTPSSIENLLVTGPDASGVGTEEVWLGFANPPADEIRAALKAIGFRYTPEDRTWSCKRSLRVDRAMEPTIPTLMEAARNRAFERIRCEIQGGHPDNARHFDEWPEFLRRCRNEGQDAAEAWLRDVLGSPRAGAEKSTCDDS